MKRAVHMLFILAVVLSGFAGVLTIIPSSAGEYTSHDPIHIEGNDDFAAQAAAESWPGEGTENNPFIIQDYEINASGERGIEIRSTTVHFIIKKIRIIFEGRYSNIGIYIREIQNGTINDCHINVNSYGIYIRKSDNITIVDNEINSNDNEDLWISASTAITLINNSMMGYGLSIRGTQLENWYSHVISSSNHLNGKPIYYWKNISGGEIPYGAGQIFLVNCNNITVSGQEIINTSVGIELVFSENNTITNNNISLKQGFGIILFNSNGNNILTNHLSSEEYYSGGIYLSYSNMTNIVGNEISNGTFGIEMEYSVENTIKNNTMKEGGIDIYGDICMHYDSHIIDVSNTVNGNPVYYWQEKAGGTIPLNTGQVILANCTDVIIENLEITNTTTAIKIAYSLNITVKDNVVFSNELYGIKIDYSNHCIFVNNDIHDNTWGIWLTLSDSNEIINNTLQNSQDGIILVDSNFNLINNNNLTNGLEGLSLYYSYENVIENNSIFDSMHHGIRLDKSYGNDIINNRIYNNQEGITLVNSDGNNITGNNISSTERDRGIKFENSHNNTIMNNNVSNLFRGFELFEANGTIIFNNIILNCSLEIERSSQINISYNNLWGIAIISCKEVEINGNTIFYGLHIYLSNSTHNNISLNILTHNWGIRIEDCSESIVWNNIISFGSWSGITIIHSTTNNISENIITNSHEGISILSVNDSIIINNSFTNNERNGISLENSTRNIIIGNNISGNNYGISLDDTIDNIIHHNHFTNNSQQINQRGDNNNLWNDEYQKGNFWDDYTGFDTDGDGVGDTELPHHGVDHYPLTNRQGSAQLDWLFLVVVFITILNITVILVIFILKKRK